MTDIYQDRQDAGRILALELAPYANRHDTLILALPRGGVPVAHEIATALHAPLDVFIVRKLGVPQHSELAFGAIAVGEVVVFNQDIIDDLSLSKEAMQAVIAAETAELKRRTLAYRGDKPFPTLRDKIIILVDDGIATGATMRAAIQSLKQCKPKKLIVAVPVAAKSTADELKTLVDEFICPMRPLQFHAVGAWYENFGQTSDEEVKALLRFT